MDKSNNDYVQYERIHYDGKLWWETGKSRWITITTDAEEGRILERLLKKYQVDGSKGSDAKNRSGWKNIFVEKKLSLVNTFRNDTSQLCVCLSLCVYVWT